MFPYNANELREEQLELILWSKDIQILHFMCDKDFQEYLNSMYMLLNELKNDDDKLQAFFVDHRKIIKHVYIMGHGLSHIAVQLAQETKKELTYLLGNPDALKELIKLFAYMSLIEFINETVNWMEAENKMSMVLNLTEDERKCFDKGIDKIISGETPLHPEIMDIDYMVYFMEPTDKLLQVYDMIKKETEKRKASFNEKYKKLIDQVQTEDTEKLGVEWFNKFTGRYYS